MENGQKTPGANWAMAIALVVVVVVAAWYLFLQNPAEPENGNVSVSADLGDNAGKSDSLGKVIFKLKAEKGKFQPSEFSVKQGYSLIIEFTAVDAKYDFGFEDPKIGFDVITEPGKTNTFGFNTLHNPVGDYVFKCIQFCPKGAMQGVLHIE